MMSRTEQQWLYNAKPGDMVTSALDFEATLFWRTENDGTLLPYSERSTLRNGEIAVVVAKLDGTVYSQEVIVFARGRSWRAMEYHLVRC